MGESIGIFGGSFDPVHNGHLEIADAALRQHKLGRVVFVPARLQPHKSAEPHASGGQRLEMVRLAIRGNPKFGASDCELKRCGKSYTIDTVKEFRTTLGPGAELFLIIGSDCLRDFARWYCVKELVSLCDIIVAARPDEPLGDIDSLRDSLPSRAVETMKSLVISTTANAASATEIRRRLRNRDAIDKLVPPMVEEYIARNNLYV